MAIPVAHPYSLDRREEALSEVIARLRNRPKKAAGVISQKVDPTVDDETLDLIGVRPEVAVASLTGGAVNTAFSLGGDNHLGDVLLPTSHWVEVKYGGRRGYNFNLMTPGPEGFRSDFGVLVWPFEDGGSTLDIRGVVSRDTFFKHRGVKDYGFGPRCVLPWRHFTPMLEFLDWINERCA